MKTKRFLIAASVGLGALALFGAGLAFQTAHAQGGAGIPEPKGRITPWAAIKIATGKVPGRPLLANFELDEGKWVYGVMVVSGKIIKEVEVDPMTGKAGEVEVVTPQGEGKEMQEMLARAVGGQVGAAHEADEKDEKDEKNEKP